MSPLGAVASKKARIVHDYTFSPTTQGRTQISVNADPGLDEVPPCLCALVLPKLLKGFVQFRQKFPTKRITYISSARPTQTRNSVICASIPTSRRILDAYGEIPQ